MKNWKFQAKRGETCQRTSKETKEVGTAEIKRAEGKREEAKSSN